MIIRQKNTASPPEAAITDSPVPSKKSATKQPHSARLQISESTGEDRHRLLRGAMAGLVPFDEADARRSRDDDTNSEAVNAVIPLRERKQRFGQQLEESDDCCGDSKTEKQWFCSIPVDGDGGRNERDGKKYEILTKGDNACRRINADGAQNSMFESSLRTCPDRVSERRQRKDLDKYPERRNDRDHGCGPNDGDEKLRLTLPKCCRGDSQSPGCNTGNSPCVTEPSQKKSGATRELGR